MAIQTKNWFKGIFHTAAFFGAFIIIAVVGTLASVLCAIPAFIFRGAKARAFGQRLIHGLFRFLVGYLRRCGLVELDAGGVAGRLREEAGLIVVANHPGVMDAMLLLSQLPQAACLMKGSLARNIVLSGTARLAGYVQNDSGLSLVKKCGARLQEGANLLVFPEGTRTVGGTLLPFKMGFALVAVLTRSPVQTVLITCAADYLGKGWPLTFRPAFPIRYTLRLGRRFQAEPGEAAKHFGRQVEDYFRATLSPTGREKSVAIPNQ